MERPKKRAHLCKKAIIHFSVCFVMGFFTGFAPMGKPSYSLATSMATRQTQLHLSPKPTEELQKPATTPTTSQLPPNTANRSLAESERPSKPADEKPLNMGHRKQVIVITPTSARDGIREVLLRRMAYTLKLVKPPLLWIVVEPKSESSDVSDVLRRTGVMYRHLVSKENFTDVEAEMEYQRNLALNHIEQHRLSGIVHFAGLSNVYDLSFFDDIRAVEVFGTWPLAKLARGRKQVRIEGPVCRSSQVVGWHLKKPSDQTEELTIPTSNFAFNSSILWDPEKWGRLSPTQGTKQDLLLKFVKQAVVEDESNLKGVPQEDCSKINLWQLHLSNKN